MRCNEINVMVVVIILTIHMINYAFLRLKTWILKYFIKFQELMKQDMYLAIKLANLNVD